jgi:hypothetical protein
MCMSSFTQYHPRPVKADTAHRPTGAPASTAEADPNLYGPKPTPPEWDQPAAPVADHDHHAVSDAVVSIAGAKTQEAGGVIVELSNGTRLLICPV